MLIFVNIDGCSRACFTYGKHPKIAAMQLLNYAYKQKNDWTCGPAVVRIILDYYGIEATVAELVKQLRTTRSGTTHKQILRLFRKKGLKFIAKENASISNLKKYTKNHWVIVAYRIPFQGDYHYSIVKNINSKKIIFHDTWFGSNHGYTLKNFHKNWRDDESSRWMLAIKK